MTVRPRHEARLRVEPGRLHALPKKVVSLSSAKVAVNGAYGGAQRKPSKFGSARKDNKSSLKVLLSASSKRFSCLCRVNGDSCNGGQ